jgi:hypothetical protein
VALGEEAAGGAGGAWKGAAAGAAASRQVVEGKTSVCIRGTGYADAESSCLGASFVPSMTVTRLARTVSMLR